MTNQGCSLDEIDLPEEETVNARIGTRAIFLKANLFNDAMRLLLKNIVIVAAGMYRMKSLKSVRAGNLIVSNWDF